MWCLVESSVNFMQTHLKPFAQITASQHLNLDGLLSQLTVMCTVYAKRAIEQGVAFVPGAPFYAADADADAATLRLSFATADVGKILKGVERLGRAMTRVTPFLGLGRGSLQMIKNHNKYSL